MGITIGVLLIALIVEVAFVAYCLVTRSSQPRARGYIRIGLLAAFVLATLLSILKWDLRWYLLAALLLIWAGLGAWTLTRKRPERAFSAWRSVLGGIGRLLLVVIVVLPAIILPQCKLPAPTGSHQVAAAGYTYTDPSRVETFTSTGEHRKVNVGCWYPRDASGKFPLVVFSHGSFGTRGSNSSTFTDLASNGYVVCSIDHPYHSMYTVDSEGHRVTANPAFVQAVADINNGKYDDAAIFKLHNEWMALRINDIELVLNTLEEQARNPGSDPVYQRIDVEHIGLIGHSLGGTASAQVARERDDVDAVINLDADLLGDYLGYVDGKYVYNDAIYPVPLLNIYTDALARAFDSNDPIDTAVKRALNTAPNAYAIHLKGTNHMSVTDVPLLSPLLISLINSAIPKNGGAAEADAYTTIETMNGLVLEFFNVSLKGEGSFSAAEEY